MSKSKKHQFGRIFKKKYKRADGSVAEAATWFVRFHGKDYSTSSEDYKVAERFLLKKAGESAQEHKHQIYRNLRIKDLLSDVISDYVDNNKSSLVPLKIYINKHLLPAFGDMKITDLSTVDIKSYQRGRLQAGAAPASINREMSALKRAYRLGFRNDPPKVERIPYIPMLREDNVRTGFIAWEQVARLKSELPKHLQLFLVLAYHTGSRCGELLNLRWDQVDLDAREITLYAGETKNDDGRVLPIYDDEMVEALIAAKEIRDKNYPTVEMVISHNGAPVHTFRKAWSSACKRAGVAGLIPHDLRRSAVRNLTRAGVPRPVAMKITGHKTESVYVRYDITDAQDLKDAGAKMSEYKKRNKRAV